MPELFSDLSMKNGDFRACAILIYRFVDTIGSVKIRSPRTWTFIFAGISVLALILIAASLSMLQFGAGQPISFRELSPQVVDSTISDDTARTIIAIMRVILILGWILLPLFIILLILSKEARKRFLRDMMFLLPILILLYYFTANKAMKNAVKDLNPGMMGAPQGAGPEGTPAPPPVEFVPPAQWVTTLTTILIALVISAVLFGIVYTLWRRSREKKMAPLRMVEREAQAALDAIQSGGDVRDAIMRCYYQMIEALKEYRGIYREQDMTPHEFEITLGKRGLPAGPVHQLTQLFEQVRYGAQRPGRRDEQDAVSSLSAIISACQKTRTS